MLYNPQAFIEQEFLIQDKGQEGNLRKYQETIINVPLKTTWKNIYKVNDLNFVTYTNQKIHPNLPTIEMDIFYKF